MNSSIIPSLHALVGPPNSGKTALFNALTGSNQRIGNFPGITVDKKLGHCQFKGLDWIDFIDLPGLYTLDAYGLDEKLTSDVLLKGDEAIGEINGVLLVIDATNIKKSLYLGLELKNMGIRFTIVINLTDVARARGQVLDTQVLAQYFSCRVFEVSAKTGEGLQDLAQFIAKENAPQSLANGNTPCPVIQATGDIHLLGHVDVIKNNYAAISTLAKAAIVHPIAPDTWSKKIDAIVLHLFWGPVILIVVMFSLFQCLFSVSPPIQDFIELCFSNLGNAIAPSIANPDLSSLVINGIIGGTGAFVSFLPPILLLFLFINVLEDFGYLGRVAFLLDGYMRRLGLPGKAVVPLLASHACQVPGIMAARTLSSAKDRLAVIIVSPMTTCSAKIPVFTMLISALILPEKNIWGLKYSAITMFVLYALGIFSAFLSAFLLKKTLLPGSAAGLFMELPEYRIPKLKNVLIEVFNKGKIFVKKVGKIILLLTVVIWFLTNYPKGSNVQSPEQNFENSYAAKIGKTFVPIFSPLGFDWKITASLIPSFGAREVVVASLGTVLNIQNAIEKKSQATPMPPEQDLTISQLMARQYSTATILSLIAWFLYSPQCIAMFGAILRESASKKWTLFAMLFNFTLAYLASFLTFTIATFFA